ncbi:DUF955 domain-containing protein [Halorientalis salina]|uniref:DUF955 domain-containing protein n=1 Tax=Halorientalis salina TaxID=2932266 RepID=UPI0010ABC3D5|nr:DUF955 domain-containing protein [Halorientalis salina]
MSTTNTDTTDEQALEQTTSFDDSDGRADDMREQLDAWIADLADLTDEALASEQFQEWLDVQSKFHDYSHRNTLLIKLQCPEATKVAGFWTWKNEFDRYVEEGENAIWIWAPIITNRCPECENSPSYHEQSGCDYDETDPEEWSEGLVGFKPTSVFDISQTDGEPLPELHTDTYGESDGLVDALLDAGETLGFDIEIVDPSDWTHGNATGVCERRSPTTTRPVIEVVDRDNSADLAGTLIHEFAHAILHFEPDADEDEAKLEVEAEAVAYIVCRYFGLDADNSKFYLAAWDGDAPETIHDRLARISRTAEKVITAVDE